MADALDILSTIIGDGPTSRLYRSLVIDQRIATSISTYANGFALEPTTFSISASPQPGGDPKALEAAIDAAIAELLANGVTQDEVDFAKLRLQSAAAKARDSLEGPGMVIGQALTTGMTLEDVETALDRMNAVTVERVNAAARAVLRAEQSATGLLLPEIAN
jgi:zinc protease